MQVEIIKSTQELQAIEDDWKRLSVDAPFSGWEWTTSWWEAYKTEGELYVLVARDEESNDVVGIAPWFVAISTARGRRIKFLGSGIVCSDYVQLLAEPDRMKDVAEAFAKWLRSDVCSEHYSWDFLSFEGLANGEAGLASLRGSLELQGHATHDEQAMNCWRLDVGPSWEDYYQSLNSKQKKRKVRDVRKKIIETGRSEFRVATTRSEFEDFYEQFCHLHQLRRESIGEPGCFACDKFAMFLKLASSRLFDAGKLLLTKLLIDGQHAASSVGIIESNIHFMYQTGMHPDMSAANPGWVMNVHNILHAHERGLAAIDYMRGDEPYKERLGAQQIDMSKFRIVADRMTAKVLDTAWQLRTGIKDSGITKGFPSLAPWIKPTSNDAPAE